MVLRKLVFEFERTKYQVECDTEESVEVLQYQLFSLTAVPPEDQLIIGLGYKWQPHDKNLSSMDFDNATDVLLCSREVLNTPLQNPDMKPSHKTEQQQETSLDEEMARHLQAQEDAELAAAIAKQDSDQSHQTKFQALVLYHLNNVKQYEDPQMQEKARGIIPYDSLEEQAAVAFYKRTGEECCSKDFKHESSELRCELLKQLLLWFKHKFFKWVDTLSCDTCGGASEHAGNANPTDEEQRDGGGRIELHRCKVCGNTMRFPRYNSAAKLLQTRKGRCGEWANCFALCCRSLGYDTRLVIDWTDHVWVECYLECWRRWVHLDPCEAVFDEPLLYEVGWGKKLTYLIGFSKYGPYDVSMRYTKRWREMQHRRKDIGESDLMKMLRNYQMESQTDLPFAESASLRKRDHEDFAQLLGTLLSPAEDLSLPGRQTGTLPWRLARGETGQDPTSGAAITTPNQPGGSVRDLSISADPDCREWQPAREEHVAGILLGLVELLLPGNSEFGTSDHEVSPPALRIQRRLQGLLQLLRSLKSKPYMKREMRIGGGAGHVQPSEWMLLQELPGVTRILEALNLDVKYQTDGQALSEKSCLPEVWLKARGNGIRTAVSLPLAMEWAEALLSSYKETETSRTLAGHLITESIIYTNLSRLCGGQVQASSENSPNELAVCAFDGSHFTKWLAPDISKEQAWICYRSQSAARLVAYSITAAQDCPERDPSSWVLEGSDDMGRNWHLLDEQRNRPSPPARGVTIHYSTPECNRNAYSTFRFTVHQVQDPNTSAVQLACLDLYTSRLNTPGKVLTQGNPLPEARTAQLSSVVPMPPLESAPLKQLELPNPFPLEETEVSSSQGQATSSTAASLLGQAQSSSKSSSNKVAPVDVAKAAFAESVRAYFKKLMEEGKHSPSEAAAIAVKQAKDALQKLPSGC